MNSNGYSDVQVVIEAYIDSVVVKVAADGRPYWAVEASDDKDFFEFITYYQPEFSVGDFVRAALSTRTTNTGKVSTVTTSKPFIIEKCNH